MGAITEVKRLVLAMQDREFWRPSFEAIQAVMTSSPRGEFILSSDEENQNEGRSARISITKHLLCANGILAFGEVHGRLAACINTVQILEVLFFFPPGEDPSTLQNQEPYKTNQSAFLELLKQRAVLLVDLSWHTTFAPGRALFLESVE